MIAKTILYVTCELGIRYVSKYSPILTCISIIWQTKCLSVLTGLFERDGFWYEKLLREICSVLCDDYFIFPDSNR